MHRIDSEDISGKVKWSESRSIDPDTRRTFEGLFVAIVATILLVGLIVAMVVLL